jgi:hypothetical protein
MYVRHIIDNIYFYPHYLFNRTLLKVFHLFLKSLYTTKFLEPYMGNYKWTRPFPLNLLKPIILIKSKDGRYK